MENSGQIRVLDVSTINKIAAGEVIERPFSVIKELVENSIDAGSTKIVVEIKEGGVTFIRITDNGCGISENDIETAFMSHATSKIENISDLNSINTLGFRGEALASIAAVSQLEVTTKTEAQGEAVLIELFAGEILNKKKTAGNTGTTILMRNLFYNTPVRKKFLKSNSAETGYISDFINKIALSRPDISFRFVNNGNEVLYTPGNGQLKAAIFSVYGLEFLEKLIDVDFEYEGIKITGYVAKPEIARANRLFEDLFVNGRYVKDKIVQKAAEDAYRTYIPAGKFPAFVLNMTIKPSLIDVNAHPQKLEIRFSEEENVYGAVYNGVSAALQNRNLIMSANRNEVAAEKKIKSESSKGTEQAKAGKNISDTVITQKDDDKSVVYPENNLKQYYLVKEQERFVLDKPIAPLQNEDNAFSEKYVFASIKGMESKQQKIERKESMFSDCRIIGQFFKTYWIIEKENKIYMVDQHAAHERILYERFKNDFKGKDIVSQMLLAPERLIISERERGIISENMQFFQKMGFDIFQEGNDFYLRSVPVALSSPENSDMLMQLVDMLHDGLAQLDIESIYDTKLHTIATIACKAAVKANDRLNESEAKEIIEAMLKLENPFTCPHGRPTIIEMTKYEIEKKFKRA